MTDRVGQQLGNYRLLGRGGQASVYLGEHVYLKSYAALKMLHAHLTDQDAQQFVQEALILARLSHPHIVRILDFAVQEGQLFLVMDYVPGGTLRTLHPRDTRLPLSTIAAYVTQVASALQYAHDQHLIHRDIKPENMLFGAHSEILLSDLGWRCSRLGATRTARKSRRNHWLALPRTWPLNRCRASHDRPVTSTPWELWSTSGSVGPHLFTAPRSK